VVLTSNGEELLKADRVLLPGVGAFSNAMSELYKLDLVESIIEVAKRGTPLLGVCLGMQLLCDKSEEFGITKGLGLISGSVIRMPIENIDGEPLKIPQIGWNELKNKNRLSWNGTILQDFSAQDAVYFVHSFMAVPQNKRHQLAHCLYGGNEIVAVIQRDNIVGCQFHPEKSGDVGLRLLQKFLEQ
tara:strand:- start:571 stop:1128 length:558 start_codon:yes stop_codon:yes gene_type:complete